MLNLNNLVNKNHNNLFANIILLKQFQKKTKINIFNIYANS